MITIRSNTQIVSANSSPLENCRDCGAKSSFFVVGVNDDHYLKKCRICGKGDAYQLPALKKRIIYLDQLALSGMMKSLEPVPLGSRRNATNAFYTELFTTLDRLEKLMLVVCPFSPIHQRESKGIAVLASQEEDQADSVGDGVLFRESFEMLRKLYVHLACGTKFLSYESIFTSQVMAALKAWLQGSGSFVSACDPAEAIKGKIHAWLPHLYPSIDSSLEREEVAHLASVKENLECAFESVETRWRGEMNKCFKDWFQQEVVGHGVALLDAYRRHEPNITSIRSRLGIAQFHYPADFAANLMLRIFEVFDGLGLAGDERTLKAEEFFSSDVFRQIPVVRIGSGLWAALAHEFARGGREEPIGSFGNDVKLVSAYLPYCDAIFIDNACARILKSSPVQCLIAETTRVFSYGTKDDFLTFLHGIEATATPGHIAKVREVYGEKWVAPPIEILMP